MRRRLQFGMRENPASDRRHGSCFAAANVANESYNIDNSLGLSDLLFARDQSVSDVFGSPNAALPQGATGEAYRDAGRLMTVPEVAELLHVPCSWVYQRTRHRCLNRIPGIRLGKYWRFKRAEILRWIEMNRRKDYTRVG